MADFPSMKAQVKRARKRERGREKETERMFRSSSGPSPRRSRRSRPACEP